MAQVDEEIPSESPPGTLDDDGKLSLGAKFRFALSPPGPKCVPCSRWSVPFQIGFGILTNALDGFVSDKNLEGIPFSNLVISVVCENSWSKRLTIHFFSRNS